MPFALLVLVVAAAAWWWYKELPYYRANVCPDCNGATVRCPRCREDRTWKLPYPLSFLS